MILDVVPVIPPDLRPLVLLESGNFATSDLNDLYRRIINRNNRLKKLMDLNAPEVIIRNEKRIPSNVDGRATVDVIRPGLQSSAQILAMIKGKKMLPREPPRQASRLLRPFGHRRRTRTQAPSVRTSQEDHPELPISHSSSASSRNMGSVDDDQVGQAACSSGRDPEEVWDVLDAVTRGHPELRNRELHPCTARRDPGLRAGAGRGQRHHASTRSSATGYNADFDGDQMAVRICRCRSRRRSRRSTLMLSTHNIFSPANGNPIVSPSQDIIMGVYFLTFMNEEDGKADHELRAFRNASEAILALDHGQISHERIAVRLTNFDKVVTSQGSTPVDMPENRRLITTVGRLRLSSILPEGMPYYNFTLGKKGCSLVIDDTFKYCGRPATLSLLDDLKEIGFKTATSSGLSIAITDLRIPERKQELLDAAQKKVDGVERAFDAGAITERDLRNQLVDIWEALP